LSESGLPTSPAALGLSARQSEVLALMMQGKSNKAICRVLDLAEPTVKYHVATILKALKVSNRTEAVLAVGTLGWKWPPVADVDLRAHAAPAEARRTDPSLPDKPSIVVMPFANLSGDSAQDYFADGMAEDITIALGRLPWLFVIGSASAFTYKNRAVDLRQIGSDLGVRYLLMGSVRKEGSRVRITVQLTDTAHGGQIWADRLEGELDSIFAMQDRVASHVSATIAPALRSEEIERARLKPTENLTAYDLFLRALPLHRDSFEHNQEALRLLYRAIELDPSYGAAYGLAAVCHFWQKIRGWVSPSDPRLMEGVRLAHLASKVGANDSEALWMAGQVLTMLAAELEVARGLAERAIALNPNSSNAWAVSAMANSYLGNHEIAFDHMARAKRLNPLEFPFMNYWAALAHFHFLSGQYEEVLQTSEKALAENPKALPALRMRIATCGILGRIEEGRDAVARLLAEVPATTVASMKAHYCAVWHLHPRRLDDFLTGLRRSSLPEG
jgi:TolB-like protein/DNA-binding CsgD family transcriptional regulator